MSLHIFICALAGACLSATAFFLPLVMPAQAQSSARPAETRAASDTVVTETHIWLIKMILRLRPDQEIFWSPVEAALRELAHLQARSADHALAPEEIAARLRRIGMLARPLIKALDDSQRRNMMALVRRAGLQAFLSN